MPCPRWGFRHGKDPTAAEEQERTKERKGKGKTKEKNILERGETWTCTESHSVHSDRVIGRATTNRQSSGERTLCVEVRPISRTCLGGAQSTVLT